MLLYQPINFIKEDMSYQIAIKIIQFIDYADGETKYEKSNKKSG